MILPGDSLPAAAGSLALGRGFGSHGVCVCVCVGGRSFLGSSPGWEAQREVPGPSGRCRAGDGGGAEARAGGLGALGLWSGHGLTLGLLSQEIFGPVLTVYVYPDDKYKETLRLVDSTTSYGLTGAVFAQDK